MFDTIPGNEKVKTYLTKLVEKDAIPQSLLFSGPSGVGKGRFAEAFAKMVLKTDNSTHPDLRHYKPEGKIGMHSIKSMREFTEEVYMAPFSAKRKVFIIHEAHRMLTYSANALLKTFEEPALDSIIILVTHAPEKLLPTVLSRCQRVRFLPVDDNTVKTIEHPQREMFLNYLASGHLNSYSTISHLTKELADAIENGLKEEQNIIQTELTEAYTDKPSAQQREMIEKEVDGVFAMKKQAEVKTLLDILLSWYRDLHLLHVGGNPSYLMNPDYQDKLEQAIQRGELLPIESIERIVSEAILSVERSTSLAICFENLFLKTCRLSQ